MDNLFNPGTTMGLASPDKLMLYIAGISGVLLLFGAFGLFTSRDKTAARVRSVAAGMNGTQTHLIKEAEVAPTGWKKALIPEDSSERAQIRFQLGKIGFEGPNVVENFFLIRLCLAFLPPLLVFGSVALARAQMLPVSWSDTINTAPPLALLQVVALGTALGFFGPGYWLKSRINARQDQIRAAFPNALDLVQISVEAGLGFDAALTRVGNEISRVAPEIAFEFLLLQLEIQAGRDRETALFDMADRMGIDEAKSFALVITQSLQFGTSLTTSLKSYAEEMRKLRELAAQEKANRLPVQMSGVMSVLMLPALFLITLTPIIIRYMAIF
ncbi:MAG: type II secretion system F family protein [Sulfitobacter sp.]